MLQRNLRRCDLQALHGEHRATLTCLKAVMWRHTLSYSMWPFARAKQHEVYPDGEAQEFCCEPTCQAYTCDVDRGLTLDVAPWLPFHEFPFVATLFTVGGVRCAFLLLRQRQNSQE